MLNDEKPKSPMQILVPGSLH